MLTFSSRSGVLGLFLWALLAAPAWPADDEFRVWTDSTGKHKLKAKFVSLDGDTLTLEKDDGTEVELSLKKLSKADQKVAQQSAENSDNPFEPKTENPFTNKKKKPSRSSAANDEETDDRGPRKIDVNLADAETIPLTPVQEGWEIEVAGAPDGMGFSGKARSSPLPPKSNFFEKAEGLAVNLAARKGVVGFVSDEPKPEGTTRVVICSLETGKTSPPAVTTGKMSPLALHDDGEQVLMRREEFGHGKQDRLEIWTLKGTKVTKRLEWTPYKNQWEPDNSVVWAEFLGEDQLATISSGGQVVFWTFPELRPASSLQLCKGTTPAVSPDRKYLAFCDGEQVGLLEIAKREVAVMQPLPDKLQFPQMTFSPTGKQIGCSSNDRVLAWSVENGELISEVPANGVTFMGGSAFPAEGYILAGKRHLVDLNHKLQFWDYDGCDQVKSAGGWTFFRVSDGHRNPGMLVAAQLPHAGALDLQKRAVKDPSLFVLKAGTVVKLDLKGIPEPSQRNSVSEQLKSKLQEIDCSVGENGSITLEASISGPQQRTISYRNSGDYTVKEWTTSLKFVHDGNLAWQTRSTNIPSIVTLKRGENIESVLRSREKPDYEWFGRVTLPRFLQKPTKASPGSQNGFGLGQSRVTATGIK